MNWRGRVCDVGGRGAGTLAVQGGRHYVESSGSDLMVFFSVLDVRCDVPFSEGREKDTVVSVKA